MTILLICISISNTHLVQYRKARRWVDTRLQRYLKVDHYLLSIIVLIEIILINEDLFPISGPKREGKEPGKYFNIKAVPKLCYHSIKLRWIHRSKADDIIDNTLNMAIEKMFERHLLVNSIKLSLFSLKNIIVCIIIYWLIIWY